MNIAEKNRLASAIEASVGLYSTSPTCHLSALARVEGYAPEDLRRLVEVERSHARVRSIRRSVYILGGELLEVALAATREELLKSYQTMARRLSFDYEEASERVLAALDGGLLASSELRALVDPDKAMGSHFQILIGRMCSECRIVRAVAQGGWRSDRFAYAPFKEWLPEIDPLRFTPEEGRRRLAAAYVEAYGPVTFEDLAWWTGWTKKSARPAAEGLDLEREGRATKLLTGLKLLPVWDVLMVAYRERDRLFDPEHERFLYDFVGNATSVVLDEGRVVGVWDLGKKDRPLSVKVAPLPKLRWPKRRWAEVEREVGRIAAMLGASKHEVVRVEAPLDLKVAKKNRFLSPLSG